VHGFSDKDLEKQLNSAASAAYFMQGNGPNYSVRIGRVSQDAKQVAKNAEEALS
jgi:ribosomal protein L1